MVGDAGAAAITGAAAAGLATAGRGRAAIAASSFALESCKEGAQTQHLLQRGHSHAN